MRLNFKVFNILDVFDFSAIEKIKNMKYDYS